MGLRLNMIIRPRMPLGQKVLSGLIVVTLLTIATSFHSFNRSAVNDLNVRISGKSPRAGITITVREQMVFLNQLEQWSVGLKTRRDVQIARGILVQRLSVVNADGLTVGELVSPEFLMALKDSDAILASTVPGFLPVELQSSVQAKIRPIADQIIRETRALINRFQTLSNSYNLKRLNSTNERQQVMLSLLFLLLVLLIGFVVSNWRSTYSFFHEKEVIIQRETEKLNSLIEEISLSESTIENLRELSETKTAFIASVNHELRTPLSSIIGYVEIIRDITDKRPELGITEYLEIVDRNANILLELVNGILTLSKLDSNKAPLPNSRVDIGQVIATAISVLRPECKKSNIDIYFSIASNMDFFIQGDEGQLNRVFLNLLSNSIKFSEVNSHIEIEVDRLNYEDAFSFVRIVIRDHGIGIPARDIDRLFMRFYRATNAVEKQFSGTGLGLAIVEQIVQIHGGNLRVESVEGEGTTIILEFPLYLSQAEKLVIDRRYGVLARAITSLENASRQDLFHVTHDIGGSIGFYTFEEESRLILDFSQWLNSGIVLNPIKVESQRQEILTTLRSRLESLLEREVDE